MTIRPSSHFHPVGSQSVTKPRKNMKARILMALAAVFGLASCVETSVTAPDGTVTTTKAPAPGSLELAGQAIGVFGQRINDSGK